MNRFLLLLLRLLWACGQRLLALSMAHHDAPEAIEQFSRKIDLFRGTVRDGREFAATINATRRMPAECGRAAGEKDDSQPLVAAVLRF